MTTLDDLARVARELPLLHNGRPALLEQLQAHASVIAAYIAAQSVRDATSRERDAAYLKVYEHARGMCFGHDWNKGTHAGFHRRPLIAAVDAIDALPKQPTP